MIYHYHNSEPVVKLVNLDQNVLEAGKNDNNIYLTEDFREKINFS